MKKYFFAIAAIVGGFMATSCENDAINVEEAQEITVRVQPEGIIDGLVEHNVGELNSLGSYSLRTHLLIYNDKGVLCSEDVKYSNSYSSTMVFNPKLSKGTFTAITIVDVVTLKNNVPTLAFWSLSDSTSLNTATIKDNGYIGSRKMLAADKTVMNVTSSTSPYTIRPERQGALIRISYWDQSGLVNPTGSLDVKYFKLLTKKANDAMSISAAGFEYSFKSDQWFRISRILSTEKNAQTTSGTPYKFGYAENYGFVFPSTNTPVRFAIETNETSSQTIEWKVSNNGSGETCDFKKGEYYVFEAEYYGNEDGDGNLYAFTGLYTYDEYQKLLSRQFRQAKVMGQRVSTDNARRTAGQTLGSWMENQSLSFADIE